MNLGDASTSSFSSDLPEIFFKLAPYYDQLVQFIDYPGWVRYISEIFRRYGRRPRFILDLACGTGNVAVLLAQQGFKMVGLDRSKEMLDRLQSKVPSGGIELICADMREFKLLKPVDACICLFDSLNYLLEIEDLERCFRSVLGSLEPAGLFVFDMNTIYGLANYWDDQVWIREVGDIYSIWQNRYDPVRRISTLYLTLFVRQGDGYKRVDEVHKERGYELSEIEAALRRAGFKRSRMYHHLTFDPPTPSTIRVMVVAEP